jgi:hypothetical protein
MMEPEEMDERTQEALLNVARAFNKSAQEVAARWGEVMKAVAESVAVVAEQIWDAFADLPDLTDLPDIPRTPPEIKKDIKHEKNPMRLKQLNKELNESYKFYKRKWLR